MARNPISTYASLQQPRIVVDKDDIKAEFARRLESHRIRKGWNQSELARRATAYLPKPEKGQKQNLKIGRDLISHYTRGLMLPRPENLEAIAKALGVPASQLLPTKGIPVPGGDRPAWHMQSLDNGRVQVHMTMTLATATKIMALLGEEDRP